jgi:hypothetical protein
VNRLRVAFKRWLARHTTIVEFCKDCGVQQSLVWTASNQLWAEVSGRGDGGGVLCPICFDRRAQRLGYLLRWVPQVDQFSATYTSLAEGRGIEPRRE